MTERRMRTGKGTIVNNMKMQRQLRLLRMRHADKRLMVGEHRRLRNVIKSQEIWEKRITRSHYMVSQFLLQWLRRPLKEMATKWFNIFSLILMRTALPKLQGLLVRPMTACILAMVHRIRLTRATFATIISHTCREKVLLLRRRIGTKGVNLV